MLKGVLALEELAGGVVSFTDAACVQGGLGAQNLVTAHRLSQEFAKSFILKSEELPGGVNALLRQDFIYFLTLTLLQLRRLFQVHAVSKPAQL